jgi:hypothetical protein
MLKIDNNVEVTMERGVEEDDAGFQMGISLPRFAKCLSLLSNYVYLPI